MNINTKKLIFTLVLLIVAGIGYAQNNLPDEEFYPVQPLNSYNPSLPSMTIGSSSSNFNYSRTYIPSKPVQSKMSLLPLGVSVNTQYFDGNGKTVQSIKHGGLGGKDIIKMHDNSASLYKKGYLPYEDNKSTQFRMNGFSDQHTFYNNNYADESGYNHTRTNIITTSGQPVYTHTYPPGASFQSPFRSTKSHAAFNDNNNPDEVIYMWTTSLSGLPEIYNSYGDKELKVEHVEGNHDQHTMMFYDNSGQLICKKVYNDNVWLVTYYVYDDYGRIIWVVPPKAYTAIMANVQILPHAVSTAIAKGLCYGYKYNDYNQIIEKYTADVDSPERTIYDYKQRPVLFRNGILAAQNKWAFTVYDENDRVIYTGIFTDPGNHDQSVWQSTLSDRTWLSGQTAPAIFGYISNSQSAYPSTIQDCEINTRNYYDSYANLPTVFAGRIFTDYPTDYLTNQESIKPENTDNVFGLLTGRMVRVLDPNNNNLWIPTKYYYDWDGKVIQTHTLNPWNTNDDWDITTTQYDFSGNTVLNINEHNSWNATNKYSTTIYTWYNYNYSRGILSDVKQKEGNNGWRAISSYQYGALDRVAKKLLGNVEEQDFIYDIQGRLIGINEDYVFDANMNHNRTFGERICYDYGFDNDRYDGKIAGYIYRGSGTGSLPRAYGYDYDDAGRLLLGDFNERQSVSGAMQWTKSTDYTAYGIQYDENGNMTSLSQMGMALVSGNVVPVVMDQLNYTYSSNSNKIEDVADGISTNYNLHDFLDNNTTGADYEYDVNGNLSKDLNKNISNISYSHLNLPVSVTASTGSIDNIYDALGNLLQKTVVDNVNGNFTRRYWGPYVYEDDQLEYFLHEEGRSRWDAAADEFKNDFFVKDHLGNVRTVVHSSATTGVPQQYQATFEVAATTFEESIFDPISPIRNNKPQSLPGDLMSGKLNGSNGNDHIGAAILLHVMAGDQMNLNAYGYYEDEGPFNSYTMPENMLSSLTTTLTDASGETGEGGAVTTLVNNLLTQTNYNLYESIKQNATDPAYPRAYLNYLAFDENFDLIPSASQVVQLKGAPNTWLLMQGPQAMTMPVNGYIMAYLSNESPIDVHVDNEFVTHYIGVLLEEQHYYPHGLTVDESNAAGASPDNMYLHQTKFLQRELDMELYDFHARQYDPQIGRFWGIDPADQFPSGYTGMGNDPANLIDPTGMVVKGTNTLENDPSEHDYPNWEDYEYTNRQGRGDILYYYSVEAIEEGQEGGGGTFEPADENADDQEIDGDSDGDSDGDWVPSTDKNGNIILTAEKGDNTESLMDFFGGKENAAQYLEEWTKNNIIYSEGDKIMLKSDNIFSKTMKFYTENSEAILANGSYDCKELVVQVIMNRKAILSAKSMNGSDPSYIRSFGKNWNKKIEISDTRHMFGKTFTYSDIFVRDHAAVYFGKSRSGTSYYFSKSGTYGPLEIVTNQQLQNTYWFWNRTLFNSHYKVGE